MLRRSSLSHALQRALRLVCTLACAGCAAAHFGETEIQGVDAPAAWSESASANNAVSVSDLGAWWIRFADPILSSLIDSALEGNTDVQQASAALEQANALRDVAAAALSATLGYSASAQRNFNGETTAVNNLQAGFNAAWNPDVSGAGQRALDAANANVQVVLAQWRSAQSSAASALALNYIVLRSSQARLAVAQENLVSQQDTLQIVQWRNQAGLIGAIALEQALAAAQQTSAQLPALEQAIARTQHALAVQTGRAPVALSAWLVAPAPLPLAHAGVQLMTPAATLLARPDVRAAQYRVTRSMADVGQAQARRYPTLGLGANLGVGAASTAALSGGSALLAGLAISLAGPLFDGGTLQGQVRAAQAALLQARAAYRGTQLLALQEVEDALVSLRTDSARATQLQSAADAAGQAASMARLQFESGLVDFQIVLETQRSQLSAQDNKALVDANVSSDQVRLYNALGGGWRPGDAPLPEQPINPQTAAPPPTP